MKYTERERATVKVIIMDQITGHIQHTFILVSVKFLIA